MAPAVDTQWWRIVVAGPTSCLLEALSFETSCRGRPVLTVLGKIAPDRRTAYSGHGQKSFIWLNSVQDDTGPEYLLRNVFEESADLINSNHNEDPGGWCRLRIMDAKNQINFVLETAVTLDHKFT